jgi:predicted neuraminidase
MMAGPAEARRGWWLRVALTLAVLGLYFVPFYQQYLSDSQGKWPNLQVTRSYPDYAAGAEEPYFSEDFVNQARPGMICHVSSLAPAGTDRLICTWYAGSREAAPDVAIWTAFFQESTGVWSEPRVLLDRQQSSAELGRWVRKVGNAVVMNDQQGGLWLFYATMLGGWSTASLNYKVSRDEGQTWSASHRLILSPFFNLTSNVKNKGLNLNGGALLLPVYHELLRKFSQVLLVKPGRAHPSFELRRMTPSGAAIQPALIPAGERNLAAFFRNAAAGNERHILRSGSTDVGQNWSALQATPLPNPDSGFDMIRTVGGAILGAINDNFRDRRDLTLVLSRDEGQTWERLRVLDHTPGKDYAYPSFTRTARAYHLTYSYEKTRIKHVVFNDAWLKEQRPHDH